MSELLIEIERRREELAALERAHEILTGTRAVPAATFKALPAPFVINTRNSRAPKGEDIPQFTVRQGVAPVRRRDTKPCTKCGQAKGCTAFARGSDVCRLCDVGSPIKKNHGGSTTATLTKTCAQCGEEKNVRAFWGGGDKCRSCNAPGRLKQTPEGGVTPKRRGRPPKEKPTETPRAEPDKSIGDLPAGRYRKCTQCDRTFQVTAFPDRTKNVCKHCIGAAGGRE